MNVNENTSMKTLFPVVAMALIGTTYATNAKSQPFIPDNRPRCSLAITRGAQLAFDAYIDSITKLARHGLIEQAVLRKLANKKLDEIEEYAAKKYKCIFPIFDDSIRDADGKIEWLR
jgi:hypothetical protein